MTIQLVLYTKPDCSLCDDLKRDLADLQGEFAFSFQERNILDDAQLTAQFQYLVPVLEVESHTLLYPPHDWLTLRNALAFASRPAPESAA